MNKTSKHNNPAKTIPSIQVDKKYNTLNLGPTHPATHGVFQNILTMDGEIILGAEQTIGYIHRAFEKIAERRPYYQITTLTDRLNYCSSPLNNIGWHLAVEKLLGVETNKRIDYMRIIVMELARISDHLICNSVTGVDSGALTGFVYVFQERERIYEIYEELCGARLTTNLGRVGGFDRDFSPTALRKIRELLDRLPKVMHEFETLLLRNRIFMDRTINVGGISAERALNYGFTGPCLRAAGVDYDLRVHETYSSYQDFDFVVPIGQNGDTYDRFCVRQTEIWESMKMIKTAMENLPEGKFNAEVPAFYMPPKEEVYSRMEPLISHFKMVMGEIDVPAKEIYHAVEGANGELGFYIVSEGGRTPYRLHFRRPCFVNYQAYPEMIIGSNISDAILTMSSMNIIAGELDA
ncbi:NADH-quinone oxidoreductase subunit D [Microbacter margulisiae]|uniref:NADH-quinone oxidoreductase subunit D n=1 Tax=Microbacter margulisiae TaxID=1350067 RepID=A0A7W5H1F3_9PORP|nr:NADH-quinone oxidoreductase subunit D [Microbacter margulisiae]MBB3186306.1 NADH-quinone oxidoreductase subunit D [Microbacter margulisiae]